MLISSQLYQCCEYSISSGRRKRNYCAFTSLQWFCMNNVVFCAHVLMFSMIILGGLPGSIHACESVKNLTVIKKRFPQDAAQASNDGFHGQLICNHRGILLGIMSFHYCSISSIYKSDWLSDHVNLEEYSSNNGSKIELPVFSECDRAVCLISFINPDGNQDFATGALVNYKGKRFILTAFHILGSIDVARAAWLEFNALNPPISVRLDPSRLHWGMNFLDFALIAISPQSLRELNKVQPLELSHDDCFHAMDIQITGYPAGHLSIFVTLEPGRNH